MSSFSLWHLIILGVIAYVAYSIFRRPSKATHTSHASLQAAIREAELIISAYGKTLEHLGPTPGATVADESKLPFPKERIKTAYLTALRASNDPQLRSVLKAGFVSLADFQSGVGNSNAGHDLSGVDVTQISDSDLLALVNKGTGSREMELLEKATREAEQLTRELTAAGF